MENKKKGRGKGKHVPLASTSIRLEQSTIDFFKAKYSSGAQAKMREILALHVKSNS